MSRGLPLLLLFVSGCDGSSSPGETAKPTKQVDDATEKRTDSAPARQAAPTGDDPWTAKRSTGPSLDPWAKDSATATPKSDPWSKEAPPPTSDSAQPPQVRAPEAPSKPAASGGMPAGTYACQSINFHANTAPSYTPTGISFKLDGNGGYSAPNFKGGPGTVAVDGNVMTFNGGSMNGWRGYTGTTSSGGRFVRIRLKDPTAIATSLSRGDGMCYLQR